MENWPGILNDMDALIASIADETTKQALTDMMAVIRLICLSVGLINGDDPVELP
jgi:hypothetical protein